MILRYALFFLFAFLLQPLHAQQIPAPATHFGFEPGEDYKLADYDQLESYYRAVAEASDRITLREIGTTHRGRPLLLLIISDEENHADLERYRTISERLARAEGLDDVEASRLADEGKAVVWIDSGLHSTELAHSQHNPVLVHHLATDNSAETQAILRDVILLNMPVMNPDGHDIVVDWYRSQRGTEFERTAPPVVYHEYIGHDTNRDWYMLLQNESRAVARVLYREWYPQIVLNHHQMGEMPPRMFIPPFDDPVNPNIPPLAVRGTNLVGEHMANRFAAEGKSGIVQGIIFNMWWNGGMRTAPYFHNMVGILTESTHRFPVPRYWEEEDIPDSITRGGKVIPMREPSVFYPDPWEGGWANMKQMVDYHMTASLGVLDIASKRKRDWLYNIYQMGRDAIIAGREKSPHLYVISPSQHDRPEAIEFLRTLRRGGLEIRRATADFEADGRTFPAGSYLIDAAQAFRPYLIDLMEPQSYPDRRLYPDGPPEPPYDMAGWTLPIQMGIDVVRLDDPPDIATVPADRIVPFETDLQASSRGYLLPAESNFSSRLVNRLLERGERVCRITEPIEEQGRKLSAGAFLVESGEGEISSLIREFAGTYALDVVSLHRRPDVESRCLHKPRIGLYQSWTANIDEGWTRWIFDNYGFDYVTLRDADLREGDLDRFDIIIFPAQESGSMLRGNDPGSMPESYVGGIGLEGAYQLKRYAERGGVLLAWDGATDFLIDQLGLPVRNRLEGLSRERFFIPGSLVAMQVDNSHPLAWGVPSSTAAFFVTRRGSRSRSFSVIEPAEVEGRRGTPPNVEVPARFADEEILLSGWALGEQTWLSGEPSALRVALGEGEVILLGFRPQFRAQPRATFKFLFNAIFAAATEERPPVGVYAE